MATSARYQAMNSVPENWIPLPPVHVPNNNREMGSSSSPHDDDRRALRQDRKDPYLRLQSVTINVRDLDRSVRFYVDQLGFDLAFDARLQSGRRSVAVAPADGAANLTLVAPDPDSEEYKLIGRPSQVALVTDDVASKLQ